MSFWRPVVGYEGLYEVSHTGLVRTVARHIPCAQGDSTRFVPASVCRQKYTEQGYLTIPLSDLNGIVKDKRVSRLVALAWLPQPGEDETDVNHKNGIKDENQLPNLEWSTRAANIKHSYDILGRVPSMIGKFNHGGSKAVESFNLLTGETVGTYASMSEAGRAGYSVAKITTVVSGFNKSHRQLGWRLLP